MGVVGLKDLKTKLPHVLKPNKYGIQVVATGGKATMMTRLNEYGNLRVRTSGLPSYDMTVDDIEIHGFKIGQNGYIERSGTIELAFLTGVDMAVEKLFEEWMQVCLKWDSGEYGDREEVKIDLDIITYSPLDDVTEIRRCHLIGCLPQSFGQGEHSGETGAALAESRVTLRFDSFYYEYK